MDNFLLIWAIKNKKIAEKIHLWIDNPNYSNRTSSEKVEYIVRGTYFQDVAIADKDGNLNKSPENVRGICRRFDYLDEANAHIKLTFQEFFDKYPHYMGRAIIDNLVIVNGKPEGFKND